MKELQLAAEEVRLQAMQGLQETISEETISKLIYCECLEARSRAIRQEWYIKRPPETNEDANSEGRQKSIVRFNDSLQIIGHADPNVDRKPALCSQPSIAERLLLRAGRIFPSRELDGTLVYYRRSVNQ